MPLFSGGLDGGFGSSTLNKNRFDAKQICRQTYSVASRNSPSSDSESVVVVAGSSSTRQNRSNDEHQPIDFYLDRASSFLTSKESGWSIELRSKQFTWWYCRRAVEYFTVSTSFYRRKLNKERSLHTRRLFYLRRKDQILIASLLLRVFSIQL